MLIYLIIIIAVLAVVWLTWRGLIWLEHREREMRDYDGWGGRK